ncbi:MAG: hypothetical protein KAJ98_06635, partial [Spirochaetaceae bacterium]|nr:hypothetical protein [Spirochaetaceae bacterium]
GALRISHHISGTRLSGSVPTNFRELFSILPDSPILGLLMNANFRDTALSIDRIYSCLRLP